MAGRQRTSLRLPDYDYAQAGAYFVTICTQNRACLFGDLSGSRIHNSPAGDMLERWWRTLEGKFPSVGLDAYVVMPNHVHGIIHLVGATPRGRPDPMHNQSNLDAQQGHPRVDAPTLGRIIGWFKTMTTNAYIRGVKHRGWRPFDGKLWQRNYYDHVIRNESSLDRIREYIHTNPERWVLDRENPWRQGDDTFDCWLDGLEDVSFRTTT